MLDEIKCDLTGAQLLADWLGDGGQPVTEVLAAFRAERCLTCQFNVSPNWWEKAKQYVAAVIKRELELKHKLDLSLPEDSKLHMCSVCKCCTRLKVWVPITHIHDHTPKEMMKQFPPWCWLRKELTS